LLLCLDILLLNVYPYHVYSFYYFYFFYFFYFFFFNDTPTTEIYTLSLHDALPICSSGAVCGRPWLCASEWPVVMVLPAFRDGLIPFGGIHVPDIGQTIRVASISISHP